MIDPAAKFDDVADVLIVKGKIAAVGREAAAMAPADAERCDVDGMVVCPEIAPAKSSRVICPRPPTTTLACARTPVPSLTER